MPRPPAPSTTPGGLGHDDALDRAPLDVGPLASRLRLSVTRLARRLRQQSEAGLTPSQLSALAAIEHHGPLTLGSLAEHEQVAPPTVTKVVAKLEGEGLVSRQVDAHDRRVAHVAVTPAGASLLDETRLRKTAWLAARIGELGPHDRARLAAALDVLDRLLTEDPS